MKKIIVLLLIFIIGLRIAHAQTPAPVIAELRTLLQSAKTNFQGEMGAQIGADSASKWFFMKPTKKLQAPKRLFRSKVQVKTYILLHIM